MEGLLAMPVSLVRKPDNDSTGLMLHLGAGQAPLPKPWVNCDHTKHSPHIDQAFDLMGDWPFLGNAAAYVYASHVLEHLPDPIFFFQELWRVMAPQGQCLLRLPYGGHPSAMTDLYHLRPWWAETFAALQPGYGAWNGNPQHSDLSPFAVHIVAIRLALRWLPWVRWRVIRRNLALMLTLFPQWGEEMFVELSPLKTKQEQEAYQKTHQANTIGLNYFVWQHDWEKRPLAPGESAERFYLLKSQRALAGYL